MLEAVQKEMNLGPVQGQTANTQNLHNLDSLKSLNNSENPKSNSLIIPGQPQLFLKASQTKTMKSPT